MLYTSNNCLIYSKDPELIGKLIINGHKVHYDSDISRLLKELHDTNPDLVVIDLFTALDQSVINSIIQVHGHVIIRGAIPRDLVGKVNDKKIILIPEWADNDLIIDRIAHINDSVNKVTSSEKPEILIVEDNADILEMYDIAFRAKGFSVHQANDGLEWVTKAVTAHPEVIILDIMMPHMDGFEVLHTLKNNTSLDCTIIVNSNLEGVDEEQKVKELGADYFLRKSQYTPLDVVSFVEKILWEKHGRAA
jgi:CheY-like chemotaxis protein